jgi:predicted 3-demethylubiquinone-9 3-methyltransferase (glyoxalase superfamily)
MAHSPAQKIVTFLWYAKEADAAARFYASVFPDSVVVVNFTLLGQRFMAMTAGPHHEFNDAISLMVNCTSQVEIDRYWNAILQNGGKEQACGWITDKWGVRWQIVPTVLGEMMSSPERTKARRVAEEMMKQVKFDIAKLEAAFEGR